MVRLGVLYTLNHGSSPCEQTMKTKITESIINQAQSLYDKIGNHTGNNYFLYQKVTGSSPVGSTLLAD